VGNQWRFKRQDVEALLSSVPSIESDEGAQYTSPTYPTKIIPLDCIQVIQDVFAEHAGVGAIIVTPNGELLTKLSNCCRFCDLIMTSESGRRGCVNLWRELARQPEDHPEFSSCNAGLQYARASIKMNGHLEGMLIAGQFYTELPEAGEEQVRLQQLAKKHGLDIQALVEAAHELPVFDKRKRAELGVWLKNVVRHLT
jgi:ligand-binding sensor protein